MTEQRFRKLALGLDGAVEGAHMGHPDFRVNGRIFATISPDRRKGMVKLTPDQQDAAVQNCAAMFEPASGAWGRQGCMMVIFDRADEEAVGEAMTLAWQNERAKPVKAQVSRLKSQVSREVQAKSQVKSRLESRRKR